LAFPTTATAHSATLRQYALVFGIGKPNSFFRDEVQGLTTKRSTPSVTLSVGVPIIYGVSHNFLEISPDSGRMAVNRISEKGF